MQEKEKKVEYVELIYDLIFVYMIGRNSSLIHHIENGFISPELYLTYIICTLITILIWYSTTMFINRYGSNEPVEYLGLFINMFLLYYMADGTNIYWKEDYYRYNIAWMLILINLFVQYYLKYRKVSAGAPWEKAHIQRYMRTLLIQAAIIAAGMPVFRFTGFPAMTAALVYGLVFAVIGRKANVLMPIDFSHLTERVMLYIVFTFGEMIIAISSYFGGGITFRNVYFSVMAFAIVAGLFMNYGYLYDKLLDREITVTGNLYMFIHIFIIFALNNLTTAMEFMREPEVDIIKKTVFLTVSYILYYAFLFMTFPFTKGYKKTRHCTRPFIISVIVFCVLMFLFYNRPMVTITASAALSFLVWYLEHLYKKVTDQALI